MKRKTKETKELMNLVNYFNDRNLSFPEIIAVLECAKIVYIKHVAKEIFDEISLGEE